MDQSKGMRLRFYSFVFLNSLLIFLWAVYLFAVQILDPHNLERERRLRYTPLKELHTPTRGYIYDRNHDVLVRTAKFYQIDFDRSTLRSFRDNDRQGLIDDYDRIAEIISSNSSLSKRQVLNRLRSNVTSPSIYISDRIRESDIVRIEREMRDSNYERGLITKYSFQQRIYPKGTLAARLFGSVRETKDTGSQSALSQLEGISGIEATYDNELRGIYGWQKRLFDGRNNPIQIPGLGRQTVRNGNSLVLTLDARIQEIVEMNLREGLETFRAKNAVAVFMNPQTGEILAMASLSNSDQNISPSEIRVLANLAASYMFEPGSTLKPITSLVALEKKLYSTSDMIDCRTYRTEHNRIIRDSHPFEDLSFQDVIVHSSNVGVSKIAEKIGPHALYERLISLGFGNRTGSDIYGESAGLFRKIREWQGFSLHSISFGQEIAVTPLQLVNAYAALANDGKLMKPYIVKRIIDENDRIIHQNSPQLIRTVSTKSALDTLKVMMRSVVDYGTASGTKLPYVSIAGKTGTAEKKIPGQTGYARNKYISNFAGFFPVENPQFAGLVLYDEPAYFYHWASMSAVVTFRRITEQIMALPDYNIVPQLRRQDMYVVTMPDLIGMNLERAERLLQQQGVNYQIAGIHNAVSLYESPDYEKKVIVNQYPKKNIKFDQSQTVVIVADIEGNRAGLTDAHEDTPSKMPYLIGLTLRQAVQEAKRHKINLIVEGSGIVSTQSIPVGKSIDQGMVCRVTAN